MNKAVVGGCIAAACAGAVIYASSTPADFSEQFITLPSGYQAHCNRQGYREISTTRGNVLVTDEDGRFVPCDARVGPTWDGDRLDENGDLLTAEQLRQRDRERRAEQERSFQERQQGELAKRVAKGRAFVEREFASNMARCEAAQTERIYETTSSTDQTEALAYRTNCEQWHRDRYEADMKRAEAGWLCRGNECEGG